jgi:hypothetical protein
MGQSGAGLSFSNGTACNGHGFTSHSVRFRIYDDTSTGFIFENHSETRLASIRGDGLAYFRTTYIDGTLEVANVEGISGYKFKNRGDGGARYFGFNTTTSTTAISMNYGNYRFSLQSDRNMVLYDGTGVAWAAGSQTSDRNLKKNIEKTKQNGLDIINKLEVVDYQYLTDIDPNDMIRTGFIAQDVEPIIPEAVKYFSTGETTGNYLMYYEKIVPFLVKGMQEQQVIINDLINRINILELSKL